MGLPQAATEDEHVLECSRPKKKLANLDITCASKTQGDYDDDENEEEDAVTLVIEDGHHPLNVVFDYEAFTYSCIIGQYDISEAFNDYYEEAITTSYDHTSFQDFLTTGGILFLSKEPTNMQRRQFGEYYDKLRKVMLEITIPSENGQSTMADEDDTVAFCQATRNAFRKAVRQSGRTIAREQLKKRIQEEKSSPLKGLYEHAVKLPTECAPVSEADQTSSFILGMLRPIFDRPDVCHIAHTATTAASGSNFLRLCKNMKTSPKNPDLCLSFKECIDLGVVEVSLDAKDTGDLCRTALWSMRLLDQIVTKFEDLEHVDLIFFQVVAQNCIFYIMRRAGSVCVAVEFARLKIAYTISDILTLIHSWLLSSQPRNAGQSTLRLLCL
ncbi:hypothetical protein BG004_003938 [Podila humilis]|nr:hypothetical protein BG004_003938 [Podila humilis]